MGKQTKSKKSDNFGKGKVTPAQVAFIVDRYLSDNSYSQTRSMFRTEASTLISRSPVHEAPKSLLSLGELLDEYICLKEQKVLVDQEKARLEQEKSRVQMLLQGMQGVMNAYNAAPTAPPPSIPAAAPRPVPALPHLVHYNGSSSGRRVYSTPTTLPVSVPSNINPKVGNLCTPMSAQPSNNKRKDVKAPESQQAAKKSRSKAAPRKMSTGNDGLSQSVKAASSQKVDPQCSLVQSSPIQGSSVAKCLFNKPMSSPPSNSSTPTTPPQATSPQSDASNCPMGISSNVNGSNINTPQEVTPTHCTVTSSERHTVSPMKHITYTVERNHCISISPAKKISKMSSKRDLVKGRLNFEGSDDLLSSDKQIVEKASTPESEQELDIFDMDLANLDLFGADFSFSELLVDLDMGYEGTGYSCEPTFSTDNISGSSHESGDNNPGADQVMSEFKSTVKVISEDNNLQCPETTTTMKSITKCIRILSPAKSKRSSLARGVSSAENQLV